MQKEWKNTTTVKGNTNMNTTRKSTRAIAALLVIGIAMSLAIHPRLAWAATPGTWSATDSMSTRRYNHTATLLSDGKVLVAGGNSSCGGQYECGQDTAEVYDPATGH